MNEPGGAAMSDAGGRAGTGTEEGGAAAREGGVADERMLTVVWGALGGGVLIFAAIVLFLLDLGPAGMDPTPWRLGWMVVALGAVVGTGILRGRLHRGTSVETRRSTAVVVWALAEGQAMIGLTGHLFTGDPIPGLAGVVVAAYLFLRHRPAAFLDAR